MSGKHRSVSQIPAAKSVPELTNAGTAVATPPEAESQLHQPRSLLRRFQTVGASETAEPCAILAADVAERANVVKLYADGLIEVLRRRYCWVGPTTDRKLRLETGYELLSLAKVSPATLAGLLSQDNALPEEIRLRGRLTTQGQAEIDG